MFNGVYQRIKNVDNFCKQIHFTPVKFTALLARPLVLRGKFFRDLRRVKNSTYSLRRTLIFSSEKNVTKCVLNSKYYSITVLQV